MGKLREIIFLPITKQKAIRQRGLMPVHIHTKKRGGRATPETFLLCPLESYYLVLFGNIYPQRFVPPHVLLWHLPAPRPVLPPFVARVILATG